jgi:hypothetical protein
MVYLAVTDPDPQKALRISNSLAQAVIEWNNQRVREKASDYLLSLEAQLKTVSTSIAQLNKSDPKNTDLPYLVNVRLLLLRDIQFMRGAVRATVGNLKLLEPAQSAKLVGLSPRYRAIIAAVATLLILAFLWLSYRAWRQI